MGKIKRIGDFDRADFFLVLLMSYTPLFDLTATETWAFALSSRGK